MKLTTSNLTAAVALSAILAGTPQAFAQAEWSGEGSLTAGSTTGNTETTDIGAGLNVTRDTLKWKQTGELSAQYNETDGDNTADRLFAALQLDRKLENDRWSIYGRGSYEVDQFSGFESRIFLGLGVGYKVWDSEKTKWSLEGGPGFKIDEVSNIPNPDPTFTVVPGVTNDTGGILLGDTEESLAVRAGSRFEHALNDVVTFTNDSDVIWADISTQFTNISAVTAGLSDALSLRVSFDVRHDTDPPMGTEQTDTATRISLVYGLGG